MPEANLDCTTERYLDAARETLHWLVEDGYVEVDLLPVRTRFHLSYASAKGRLIVSFDAARRRAEVVLAPPDSRDARKRIDSLREARVSLEALRSIHGLARGDGALGTGPDEDAIARLRAYLEGLKALRDHELAGDWSRFGEALSHRPPEVTAEVERIRDPQLRAIMRQLRPPR
jgi:hypothetical protein